MSDSPPFCPSSSESQGSSPQADIHTCDPCGTSCQQMAESQQESNTFNSRTAAVNRRHSIDGTISSGRRGTVDSDRFHPYRRPLRDDLQQCSSSYGCLQEVCSPDTCSDSPSHEAPSSWDQYNGSFQISRLMSSYPELPAVPVEPSCFLSQSYPSYSSPSSLQQASSRLYGNNDQSNSTKYSLSTQSHQESVTQSLFPKPIYSYSILIFLALKNSRTGSLPVSEIYSFMTEHFPFFKTAPDGWKNSVRHNLSLNKCFVKVENKNGNSSRKGCLWALNPAKVEKMQEELHKWRRKDPITVRRSMARPECLDRLLGDEPDKQRSLPLYTNNALLSRVSPIFSSTSSSRTPPQAQPPCVSIRHPEYASIQPQLPCYVPHAAAYPSMYSPCGQPTANGSLNSPIAGKIPSAYNGTTQADCSDGPRIMQEFLLEGDASYDVDTLNPSLTDLQLQGNIWEELRKDSLVSDLQITTTTPTITSALQDHHVQSSCQQVTAPTVYRRKAEYEDGNTGSARGCWNGLHPVVYSGMESLAGYLTCTTSISLI
ncbi:Forkhead box protein N1 Winged-helix transcription factor nude [Larimichthys crocea]|uniref:Forkhead box protein N1 Winged-helix transcription factor nude n=1 Tax=Larimichthys crocea TaxID=215358 RepID=A0A6G0IVQ2_LARCR|nr:Forkhead box protein N1 Winged-helix transcription factor nude [Larimichthys crocea]